MKLIAHRGKTSSGATENTINALIQALDNPKIHGVEFDIRETKDGEFVLMHDSFINRTTKGSGQIKKMSLEELLKYDITKLEDVLKIETDKLLLIELKDVDMNVEKFVNLLNKYNRNIYVDSFYNSLMHDVLSYKHNFKVGILNYIFNSEKSYSEYDFICLLRSNVTDDVIKYFDEKKIEIFLYGLLKKAVQVESENLLNNCYDIIDV